MRYSALAISVVLVVSGVVPVAAAVVDRNRSQGNANGYTGQHIAYNVTNNAVVNYRVGGQRMLSSMQVQSASAVDIGLDAALSTVTGIVGARVTGLDIATKTSAVVKFESGARLHTHDNGHGILVLKSGAERQVVQANLSADATANRAGANRVVVATGNGSKGTFIVVGGGKVAINDQGNVVAQVSQNGRLIYRTYPDERRSTDVEQEKLIANGTVAGELYVQKTAQDDDGGAGSAVDVVSYGEDTTVTVKNRAEQSLTFAAESESEGGGKVFITSVSEDYGPADEINVTVDGNAAVRAQSYEELATATRTGQQSKFLVSQSTGAKAAMDVVVAVNSFSTREVTVSGSGDGGGGLGVGIPGFGVAVALLALAGVATLARARMKY